MVGCQVLKVIGWLIDWSHMILGLLCGEVSFVLGMFNVSSALCLWVREFSLYPY